MLKKEEEEEDEEEEEEEGKEKEQFFSRDVSGNDFCRFLVVLGNAGIGKTCLSFLYIRCLLELGVKRLCHRYKSDIVLFLLEEKTLNISFYNYDRKCSARNNYFWNPTQSFIPSDIKSIINTFFNKKYSYFILDDLEFKSSLYKNYNFTVLFSSPDRKRWEERKESDGMRYYFGMEMWSETELGVAANLIGRHYPSTLCNSSSRNLDRYKSLFDLLKLDCKPPELYRSLLFGTQVRYEFGTEEIVLKGLDNLYKSLLNFSSGNLDCLKVFDGKEKSDNVFYKILQLDYKPSQSTFFCFIPSRLVFDMALQFAYVGKQTNFFNTMELAHDICPTVVHGFFEMFFELKLMEGFKATYRHYEYKDCTEIDFPSFKIKSFYYKKHGDFSTFHLEKETNDLLGKNVIDFMVKQNVTNLFLKSAFSNSPTIDGIIVKIKKEEEKIIDAEIRFCQVTKSNTHGVSPTCFISLLLMCLSIQKVTYKKISCFFDFFVENDKFHTFKLPSVVLLEILNSFYPIEIGLVALPQFALDGDDKLKVDIISLNNNSQEFPLSKENPDYDFVDVGLLQPSFPPLFFELNWNNITINSDDTEKKKKKMGSSGGGEEGKETLKNFDPINVNEDEFKIFNFQNQINQFIETNIYENYYAVEKTDKNDFFFSNVIVVPSFLKQYMNLVIIHLFIGAVDVEYMENQHSHDLLCRVCFSCLEDCNNFNNFFTINPSFWDSINWNCSVSMPVFKKRKRKKKKKKVQ